VLLQPIKQTNKKKKTSINKRRRKKKANLIVNIFLYQSAYDAKDDTKRHTSYGGMVANKMP
jgi:hypothetical protein